MKLRKKCRVNKPFLIRVVGVLVLVVVSFSFMKNYQFAQVYGTSMTPTLENQQIVLIHKEQQPQRYDLAVFINENKSLIKRVIGLPGDSFVRSGNRLLLGGDDSVEEFSYTVALSQEVASSFPLHGTIPEQHYFVIGDAINNSRDSRVFGLVSLDDFTGVINPLFP